MILAAMAAAASVMANRRAIFDGLQQTANIQNKQPEGLDGEMFPFYALLPDREKVVYEEILAGIENGEKEIVPSYELRRSTVSNILHYISYDQPQLFWYESNDCLFTCGGDTEKVLKIEIGYNILAQDLEHNRALVEDAADRVLQEADGLSDIEAERFFHDYLCKNTTYQSGAYDQNIYSVFVENRTVCSGYTRAFQYLMMKRGVPCYFCVGTLYSMEERDWVYHAWNLIKINGNYYNCDVTWDDFYSEADKYPSYIAYEYFNTLDAQIIFEVESGLGRLRTGDGMLLPACDADDVSYQALYGTEWEYDVIGQLGLDGTYMIDSVESFFDFLYTQAINRGIGDHRLTFLVKGSDTIEQIENLSGDEYQYSLIYPVADYIGSSGWSGMNFQYQYYPLCPYDEYFYMEYQLDFY